MKGGVLVYPYVLVNFRILCQFAASAIKWCIRGHSTQESQTSVLVRGYITANKDDHFLSSFVHEL